jgi:hypothetical protein
MIRATVLRALVLTAAFAAGLTPLTCLGENSDRLPAKATKELQRELLSLLRQKQMPKYSPIVVRLFKEEAELEVWKQDTTGLFRILKIYPICRWSGRSRAEVAGGRPSGSRGVLYNYTRVDESQLQLLSCDQRRLLYQESAVSSLRTPRDLIRKLTGTDTLPAGGAMFRGTPGAIGGIRPGTRFEMELEDPVLGRTLRHAYYIEVLPVVS